MVERVGPVSYKIQLNDGQTYKRHLDLYGQPGFSGISYQGSK